MAVARACAGRWIMHTTRLPITIFAWEMFWKWHRRHPDGYAYYDQPT